MEGDLFPARNDEALFEQARTQWQFGDWDSLTKLSREEIAHAPERAKLALLAASGHLQGGDLHTAHQFIRLAKDWGCPKQLITRVLVAGVHNALGRSRAILGEIDKALDHFTESLATASPKSEVKLFANARASLQLQQLGIDGAGHSLGTLAPMDVRRLSKIGDAS